uniref:CDK-activating kinase assembly factor MAT1 n=1 Tax=Crypthecodinium cohnii TaxID=2866 RepID=A0A516AGX1_CRYCO|nr:CDK-activating kinase assembly factor MAT1 [Crypthecodinium cohnii]USW07867.1 CDK-activating kinase assembly factor MAT1 [Crypthecodinium cohnii]
MAECSACQQDYYYDPEVKVLYSEVCDHTVCQPCISRLYNFGPYKCPACEKILSKQDFRPEPRWLREVATEIEARRQILYIYCKTENDFRKTDGSIDMDAWNDYLDVREDLIYRLANPTSTKPEEARRERAEIHKQISAYEKENDHQIKKFHAKEPHRKFRKLWHIIEQETITAKANSDVLDDEEALHPLLAEGSKHEKLLWGEPPPAYDSPEAELPLLQLLKGDRMVVDKTTLEKHMLGGGYKQEVWRDAVRKEFRNGLLDAIRASISVG